MRCPIASLLASLSFAGVQDFRACVHVCACVSVSVRVRVSGWVAGLLVAGRRL